MSDASVIVRQRAAAAIAVPAVSRRISPIVRRCRAPCIIALLVAGDAAAVIAATAGVEAVASHWNAPRGTPFTAALAFVALAYALGLYATPGPSRAARFRLRTIASLGAVALALLISPRAGVTAFAALAACEAALLVLVGHYAEAALRSVLMRAGLWGTAAVVVNCDEEGRKVTDLLRARPEIGLSPVGYLAGPDEDHGADAGPTDRLPSLRGSLAALGEAGAVVIFTSRSEMARVVLRNNGEGARYPRLLLVEDAAGLGVAGLRTQGSGDAIGIEVGYGRRHGGGDAVKRVIDLCLAVPLALMALPVIAMLAALIVLMSRGTPFYWQERVGHLGKPIRILKLRTMYADAERRLEAHLAADPGARAEWERFFKLKHDPRILPVFGNFVRCSSLDELPQLWNVIRGDLSLVGPRPFPGYHVAAFDSEFQALRASIKPGLTGLWQISARSNGDIAVQKAQDSLYIRHWSLWLDFYILLETLPAVLRRDGAR